MDINPAKETILTTLDAIQNKGRLKGKFKYGVRADYLHIFSRMDGDIPKDIYPKALFELLKENKVLINDLLYDDPVLKEYNLLEEFQEFVSKIFGTTEYESHTISLPYSSAERSE